MELARPFVASSRARAAAVSSRGAAAAGSLIQDVLSDQPSRQAWCRPDVRSLYREWKESELQIVELPVGAATWTVGEALAEARRRLGGGAELELARDVLEKLVCPRCGQEESLFMSLGSVPASQAQCPRCPDARREVVTFFKIHGDEPFLARPLAQIGVPLFDILIARHADRAIGLELTGDRAQVLGAALKGADKP